jgi:hypothetical protein
MSGYKSKKINAMSRTVSSVELIESLAWNDPELVERIVAHELGSYLNTLEEAAENILNGSDTQIAMFSTNPCVDYHKILRKTRAYKMVLEDFIPAKRGG